MGDGILICSIKFLNRYTLDKLKKLKIQMEIWRSNKRKTI